MKKSIKNLVLGAVMAIGVFGASSSALAYTQYVQTDMNFRKGPAVSATLIGSVPAGAKVDVQDSVNGWDFIEYNGMKGYIHGGNVADSYTDPSASYATAKDYFDNAFAEDAKNLPETGDGCHTVKVSDGYLALRSAPTYEASNEIGRLYTGDIVRRTSNRTFGSYIEVYCPKYDAYGYVNAGFLR